MAPGSLPLPLKEDNPLLVANDLYRKYSQNHGTEFLAPGVVVVVVVIVVVDDVLVIVVVAIVFVVVMVCYRVFLAL